MSEFLTLESRAAIPMQIGETRITLIEKDLRIQPPGLWGLLFWRRPAAVVVERPGADRQVLPIPDVTRLAQVSLLGAGLLVSILIWVIGRKSNR